VRQYEELPPIQNDQLTKPYYSKLFSSLSDYIEAIRRIANHNLDSAAIAAYQESLEGTLLPNLEPMDYVLKFKHRGPLVKTLPAWTGPYKILERLDPDNYAIQNLVENYNEPDHASRCDLIKVNCKDDDHARAEAAKDTDELTPTAIFGHTGTADNLTTLYFHCKVKEFDSEQSFRFKDIQFTNVLKEYIEKSSTGPNGLKKLLLLIESNSKKGRARIRTLPQALRDYDRN
jgi:hypothetical protein